MRLFFPVAIIGAACRLPGQCRDLSALWDMLENARDAVSEIPADRWSPARFAHSDKRVPGRSYTARAGLIEHLWDFDAAFFGISAGEAPFVDPQQRLALELAWDALQDAGILPSTLAGTNAAVFFGASAMDKAVLNARDIHGAGPRTMTGTSLGIVANRVSHFLDLRGPSVVMDTACSSSLYALYHACQALAADDSLSLALAGGVNELLTPDAFIGFSKANMLSPRGRCATFDAEADGYVRGEGGGVVILKPLERALADGDRIHAVIRACGVNSDGRTNGISLPSQDAQEELLREIYLSGHIHPDDLVYVEAHGTGTSAGDPVETGALGTVLGHGRSRPLPIGSIKSNIGHLEPAAGMAGLMKAILVLRQQRIPQNLHFRNPNPAIDFQALNLEVVDSPRPLPQVPGRPCVGVNSFAFGGSNAHVVIEAPPEITTIPQASSGMPPLFLSARSRESLQLLAARHAALISAPHAPEYADLAANAVWRRDWLRHRLVVTGETPQSIAQALGEYAAGERPPACCVQAEALEETGPTMTSGPRTAFVFSGNGSQWQGMGMALMANDPVFAVAVQGVAAELQRLGGVDVIAEMHRSADESRMHDTMVAQPLLFAVQVGLVESLRAKGFTPDLVFGHSVGEAASLWASGALSLADAAAFIHFRGVRQAATKGLGGMLAANISAEDGLTLSRQWHGKVEVAGDNSPSSITLTGDTDALATIAADLTAKGIFCKTLPLDYPFHSRLMDGFRDALLSDLRGIRPRPAAIPFLSTVTGQVEDGSTLGAGYLWRNVREPVQFRTATQTALDLDVRIFLEIGPHGVLRYYLDEGIRHRNVRAVALTSLQRGGDETRLLEDAWKKAWASGWTPDLDRLCPRPGNRVDLPLYPWNRQAARPAPSAQCIDDIAARPAHPLLGWRKDDQPVWENLLDTDLFPVLNQHRVMDMPLFPAAGYVEIAAAAAREIFPDEPVLELRHMFLLQSLPLHQDQRRAVRVSFHAGDGLLSMDSRAHANEDEWMRNMRCRIVRSRRQAPAYLPWTRNPGDFGHPVSVAEIYEIVPQYGFFYGPSFAALESVWRNGDACLAHLTVRDPRDHEDMLFSPALLDAALHLSFIYLHETPETRGVPFLPVGIARSVIFAPGRPAWVHFQINRIGQHPSGGDITYFDQDGRPLLLLETMRLRRTDSLMTGMSTGPGHVERLRPAPHPLASRAFPLPEAADLRRELPAADTNQEHRLTEFRSLVRAATVMTVWEALESAMENGPTSAASLAERIGLAAPMRPYLFFLLRLLAGHHLVEERDTLWTLTPRGDLPGFQDIWKSLMAEFPAHAEELSLLGQVHLRLPFLLRADQDLGQVLSPSRLETADPYQARTLPHSPLTPSVRLVLASLARTCPPGERLRILNPVPGAAALLETLLPDLDGLDCDIVTVCANERERDALRSQWGDRDYLFFEIPGTEPACSPQASAHCVLAVHALHAEDDLLQLLRACLHRLLPGGILLLAQHEADIADDLIFGLDARWWKRSARPDEPVSPLLGLDEWQEILRQAGFDAVEALRSDSTGFILQARKPWTSAHPQTLLRPENPGPWILLVDSEPSAASRKLADTLLTWFADLDMDVRLVPVSPVSAASNGKLILENDEAWQRLWTEKTEQGVIRCVSLLGFDDDPSTSEESFIQRLEPQTIGVSQAVRGWLAAGMPEARMWIVTGGAFGAAEVSPIPSQGAVWGLGRVLMNETPNLRVRLVDLPADPFAGPDARGLWLDLVAPDQITESVLFQGTRRAPRLEPLDLRPAPRIEKYTVPILRLEPGAQPRLEQLEWRPAGLSRPGPGQVLVRNLAAGVNFRDIMLSLGLLPDEAFENGALGRTLGIEFSGVVEEVGPGVTEFATGDQVAGIASQSLATHVLALGSHVVPKPLRLTHAEAATLPTTFCTAWYAMVHLARLQAGESILIHGAAGGVGLAAIQIARHLGLTVHATAGSEAKRDVLRLLGVDHVHDSRSLAFADEIRALRGGVDAVLNSLAGEAMHASLDLLNPYGRFLELGKRDYFADTSLGMRPLRRNISYFSIDIDALAGDKPELVRDIFRQGWALVEDGVITPLPLRQFPAQAATQAFRTMQQARHTGKLVLDLQTLTAPAQRHDSSASGPVINPAGTCLVTGGTSGFGLSTARWLVDMGARHVILLSRGGLRSETDTVLVERMRATGADVRIVQADVADATGLTLALDQVLADMPSLKTVIHAAAVLDDCLLPNLTACRMRRVLRVKALGAWNLHRYTRELELDFFVLFSSATTLVGNPGQGNYVAANMALETLARTRAARGLPALAVCWGPVADVGMLTRAPETLDSLKKTLGLGQLHSAKALQLLGHLLSGPETVAAVFSADAKRVLRLPAAGSPRFALLRAKSGDSAEVDASLLRELRGKPRQETQTRLAEVVRKVLASVLRMQEEHIRLDQPLGAMGVDSLMAVELGLALESTLGEGAPHITMSTTKTVADLAENICAGLHGQAMQY